MTGKLEPVREREFMAIASRVVANLLKRMGFNSCRSAAFHLRINTRTMAKLNPKHPGTGLKLETLEKILYRIEETMRYEQQYNRQEIDGMMSEARREINNFLYGPFVPRIK